MIIWEKLDQDFFILINNTLHNDLFDFVMPFIRNQYVWIPLYIFLIIFVLTNFKNKGWWWVLFFILLPIFTDFVSSRLIKENISRLRPCNDMQLSSQVRFLLNHKPQNSSFTSSHATNHFGLAAFLYYTLEKKIGNWSYLFFLWAFVICYAQVYVGVHYPLDVICGGLLGYFIGKWFSLYFNKKFQLA